MADAVVLVSGGLDSATTLAIAREQGFDCHALTFDYGQRHSAELDAAYAVATALAAASHSVATIDLAAWGGSALTDDIDVPKDGAQRLGIPVTYVPARNTIFLAHALGCAEARGARDIFIGVNAVDYSGYPDCREAFIRAFEHTANLATRAGVEGDGFRIHAPLIKWSKARIIAEGTRLGVDYALTISCYDPQDDSPCGCCEACRIRAAGFAAASLADPA